MGQYKAGQSIHNRDSRRRKKKEKGIENIFEETMAKNFPNLMQADIDTRSTHGPKEVELKQANTKYITIKMAEVKERILKAARETQSINYKGTPIRLSAVVPL